MTYEKAQPVEIEFIASKMDGSGDDVSRVYFYIVRFTGADVKPEDKEKTVIIDNKVTRRCVHFLHSFNRKTLKYAVTDPLNFPVKEGPHPRAPEEVTAHVMAARRKQEVPAWLLKKLAEKVGGLGEAPKLSAPKRLKMADFSPQNG